MLSSCWCLDTGYVAFIASFHGVAIHKWKSSTLNYWWRAQNDATCHKMMPLLEMCCSANGVNCFKQYEHDLTPYRYNHCGSALARRTFRLSVPSTKRIVRNRAGILVQL
ncbi:hypothetical protein F441_17987 [Phytophthora nicotianae CJ01A1]|uniref:Uncharacterized protein n=5 Tax=Phytophthora nicotianae TaxID=4792 RepID=W2PM08_PHYN3|nr:hypothetical protein PPTG_23970 [Phytophthora nicotianae INRA-310]ETI35569.1 hypothetical protein F443_18106 [Phytophthora nicotianae P1569]ETM35720.1 hypothetical protein L914_17418 [Phytophthora nicotianae]ETO64312.1 hypothetical protein F444_18127 [Phytophthora nicotianae P1976]ETP05388.1 hypothetical protein F441_17987 [Phytophthora nicotianae CJ01A1]ETN02043.1 hypothetical protein PPTG_23970 [Phytophthora nicotianae INRA-310]